MIVTVEPRTALERTRIADHGDKWEVIPQLVKPKITTKHFCKSILTGHIRWFLKEQCN